MQSAVLARALVSRDQIYELLVGTQGVKIRIVPGMMAMDLVSFDGFLQTLQGFVGRADPGETGGPVEGGADENVIIVTAQGRQQQLADVPVAISAINAETLKKSGANDIRELNQIAPSLLVSSTGNEANGSARVRGIGTVGDNPGLESSVAVFVGPPQQLELWPLNLFVTSIDPNWTGHPQRVDSSNPNPPADALSLDLSTRS